MFTGIIEDIGVVKRVTDATLEISTKLPDISIKDSISINGICLTITDLQKSGSYRVFKADYSRETYDKTTISRFRAGCKVNLERALKAESRLGGHIVSGHVESVGIILKITEQGNSKIFEFSCPAEFGKYIIEKGSIAIDGISLTIASVKKADLKDCNFSIVIIPFTLNNTTLAQKNPGDFVNIETDMLAKYAQANNVENKTSNVTYDLLKRTGFIQ